DLPAVDTVGTPSHGAVGGSGGRFRWRHKHFGAHRSIRRAIAVVSSAVMVTSCGHTVLDGRAVSMRYDPYRVAGLPASDGPSGPREPPPPPATRVLHSPDGDTDR